MNLLPRPRLPLRTDLVFALGLSVATLASKGAELVPRMTIPETLQVSDPFTDTAAPPGWEVSKKGKIEFGGGEIKGTEIPANHHPALVRHPITGSDFIFSFAFRFGEASTINLSIDDTVHNCRLLLTPEGFTLQKDDRDRAGPDKSEPLQHVALSFGTDEWHTALVEIRGAEIVAQIDDAPHVAIASHPQIDQPKAYFGFTMLKGPGFVRDVKVWSARPRPDWEKIKATFAVQKSAGI